MYDKIKDEVNKSYANYGEFASAHEAISVLREEVEELWDEVKKKQKDYDFESMKTECIQIASMAVKFYKSICLKENRR